MSIPSVEGLPRELESALPYSLPVETRSTQMRVQPSNLSSIVSNTQTLTASAFSDLQFPIQSIIFDLPCQNSPSSFLDNRQTSISFRITYEIVNGGTTAVTTLNGGVLRSNASSYFDRFSVLGQNGNYLEDIAEYGLTVDTLVNLQMSNSQKDGVATAYGFGSNNGIAPQGHIIGLFAGASRTLATGNTCTHSYTVPVVSGVIGAGASSFINLGRTSKMQAIFQTAPIAPVSILNGTAGTAATIRFTMSDITLNLEYIDIGPRALAMLDSGLIDRKSYIHGLTYKTATNTLPAAVSGTVSLLAGLRGSSVKSLFTRWHDLPVTSAGSANGKYDSKLPNLSLVNYNSAGIRFPNLPISALLHPAMLFKETQSAIGSFNSTEYAFGGDTSAYCKLSAGGAAQGVASTTQDYAWTLGTQVDAQALCIFGASTESIARRGLLSGTNMNSSSLFLEMTVATPNTNQHSVYVMGQLDCIIVHDVATGDMQVRI